MRLRGDSLSVHDSHRSTPRARRRRRRHPPAVRRRRGACRSPSKCRRTARSAISPSPSPFSSRGRCARRRARSRRNSRDALGPIPGVSRVVGDAERLPERLSRSRRVPRRARPPARSSPEIACRREDHRRAHGDQSRTRRRTSATCATPRSATRSSARCAFRGTPVEVQNYIDDTGVQVADVVVGFRELESKSVDEVATDRRDDAIRLLLLGSLRARHRVVRRRTRRAWQCAPRRCTISSTAAATRPPSARSSSIGSCARTCGRWGG